MLKNFIKNKNLFYFFYIPIFANFIINFFGYLSTNKIKELNFYNLTSTVLLFFFAISIGVILKEIFSLPYISTGIILYFMSFFIIDNLILFFNTDLKFSTIFIMTNIIWIGISLVLKKYYLFLPIFIYSVLNFYNNYFLEKLSIGKNIIGDVKDIHYQHVKNIYEFSYYYSMNNPSLEGYPQISAYIQSLLNQLSLNTEYFINLSPSINVLFLLFILFFFEVELSNGSKVILLILFISLVLNSQWLKFLFIDSLMTEGVLSYLFVVLFLSCLKQLNNLSKSSYLVFFLMGLLYLSKQFFSILSIVLIVIFIIKNSSRKFAIAGLFGFFLKEVRQVFYFKDIEKDYHLKEVDLIDTFFDLILLRDLKINNIALIIKNLTVDIPVFLLFLYLVFLTILYFYYFRFKHESENLIAFIVYLNFLFIFILYITIWRSMELETPIRYMLNLLPVSLYLQFKIIDKFKFEFSRRES